MSKTSPQLLIFYLADAVRHYTFPHFIRLINGSKYKDRWSMLILTCSNDGAFYEAEMAHVDISYKIVNTDTYDNYMNKVRCATQFAEMNKIPYMMKCDNDIFLPAATLDYMIDNLHLLDNSKHLTIGPTLSSGIPGVEYFAEQFLSSEDRKTLYDKFLQTPFVDRDGVNYSQLNKFTVQSSVWNKTEYFEGVRNLNHHYLGIHPIRINYDAIDFLNTCILKNKDALLSAVPSSCIRDDSSPYLCNSIFCIKTDTYKSIIYDPSLFVDAFDEVPVNKYAWKHNMNHVFVENGYAIHMLYNWYQNHHAYEHSFCEKLFSVPI
jgi:hypothetical protein